MSTSNLRELGDNNSDGTRLGQSSTSKISFWGATPTAQRSGAAQAAVTTAASVGSTFYGFATTVQADALVTLTNEMRAVLVAAGLMAGA